MNEYLQDSDLRVDKMGPRDEIEIYSKNRNLFQNVYDLPIVKGRAK